MRGKDVKKYVATRYREIAKNGGSCCSSCGCGLSTGDIPLTMGYSIEDLRSVPDASIMGLGCGNPIALANLKEGEIVLDLGSGGGIDVFLAAKKVGLTGRAIGIDMTEEMIGRAQAVARKYGYGNVEFRLGEIENLPIEDGSVDVVISNCVINLSPEKERVFQEAYRVLKPSGRIVISDLVADGKLPEEVKESLDAWAGCIAGALEKVEYLNIMRRVGFQDVRVVSETVFTLGVTRELKGKIKSIQIEAQKPYQRSVSEYSTKQIVYY
ncbi:MAG: arsenite methyltransferase [Nitrososphaeria archaeon]